MELQGWLDFVDLGGGNWCLWPQGGHYDYGSINFAKVDGGLCGGGGDINFAKVDGRVYGGAINFARVNGGVWGDISLARADVCVKNMWGGKVLAIRVIIWHVLR